MKQFNCSRHYFVATFHEENKGSKLIFLSNNRRISIAVQEKCDELYTFLFDLYEEDLIEHSPQEISEKYEILLLDWENSCTIYPQKEELMLFLEHLKNILISLKTYPVKISLSEIKISL